MQAFTHSYIQTYFAMHGIMQADLDDSARTSE
jgi:hypothetical protein